jgi:hypothetical protein
VQAELDDVQDQLRKEEDSRNELEDHVKSLRQETDMARTELALAKVSGGSGLAAAAAAGSAVVSSVDSAKLVELEALLDARTRELAELGDK